MVTYYIKWGTTSWTHSTFWWYTEAFVWTTKELWWFLPLLVSSGCRNSSQVYSITVCLRSSDTFCRVIYDIKWVTTSWTDGIKDEPDILILSWYSTWDTYYIPTPSKCTFYATCAFFLMFSCQILLCSLICYKKALFLHHKCFFLSISGRILKLQPSI